MPASTIPTARLGTSGPLVGIQGLGCMGMSEFYGTPDDTASLATLNHAIDLGVTLIDTADTYGFGANESLIGPIIRARRSEVVVATKFGFSRSPADPADFSISNDPAYIHAAVDTSLKRLGVEVIDLYYMHRRNPAVPLAESVGAMADLVRQGKVLHLGLSEVTAAELREAHAIHPVAALQSEWSIFTRDAEADIVPAAAELGIAFVAFSPLGRGLLTGVAPNMNDPRDMRARTPRFVGENGAHNAGLVARIAELAIARDATAAQIALAWVHQRAAVHGLPVIPIPGTRKISRLEENVAATTILLTPQECDALDSLAAQVSGSRAPR